ncbi:uncharacterized protein LOC125221396 [Salvia hispanica]|uniref:uncharacterized protein LOC125221396 n=1 Tax=Salvia hispanica TaxID=49212 RepID=UPI0020090689|nr:uncharacterized protein LOC125221396 [Salvia hispanica]
MASSSSSPHSSSSKSSQPLHNFELPPLLKWHRKNGKSATTPKRNRSTMKTTAAAPAVPPPPQPEPPLLHLVAAAALFEADLMPPPPPREPVGGKAKEAAALDDEFERLSLLREESRRNNRGREADQPPVISYSRNHQKKSSSSSSSAKNRHSFNKTLSISHAPAPRLSPPKFPAPPGPKVLVNYVDPGHRRRSTNASAIEAESYSWSSYYKGKGSDAKSEKSASSSAWKKHDWFNKSSPAEDADAFSKIPFYKKFEFVSKSKPDYSLSNSEFKLKFEVPEEDHSSKIEKLSMVAAEAAEAAAPHHNLYYLKKSAKANSKDKMKSKVVEDSHLPPKKKPSFAIASPINPKIPLLKPKLEKPDAPEKKSKSSRKKRKTLRRIPI